MIEVKARTMADDKNELIKLEVEIMRKQEQVRLGDWRAEIDLRFLREQRSSLENAIYLHSLLDGYLK